MDTDINPLFLSMVGGILIGLSALLMMLFNGRITGISGILSGVLSPTKSEWLWRAMFIAGLLLGGLLYSLTLEPLTLQITDNSLVLILAGLLVGFGTRLGGGCTSGHGVCGISRGAARSILATIIFMTTAVATVFISKGMGL